MTSEVTRWGVAGTGGIVQTTLPDLRLTENVEVVAVSSRSEEKAVAFAAEHGIARGYGDYARLLADPDVDVVYICTPHGSHLAMAAAAIEAGKHVLCEKPLTLDAGQARDLAGLARDRGVFLMEAMWTRFNPTIRRLQETVASGVIGEVRYVNAGFGFPTVPDPDSRFWDPAQGGGALLDVGIYPITLAHLLMGRPDRIAAMGTIREDGVDETAMMTLAAGEAIAHAATTIVHALPQTATISGTTGHIAVDAPFWCPGSYTVFAGGGAPERVTVELEGNGYVPMFRATSAAVLEGLTEHPDHPLSVAVEVLEVIDEVRALLRSGSSPSSFF